MSEEDYKGIKFNNVFATNLKILRKKSEVFVVFKLGGSKVLTNTIIAKEPFEWKREYFLDVKDASRSISCKVMLKYGSSKFKFLGGYNFFLNSQFQHDKSVTMSLCKLRSEDNSEFTKGLLSFKVTTINFSGIDKKSDFPIDNKAKFDGFGKKKNILPKKKKGFKTFLREILIPKSSASDRDEKVSFVSDVLNKNRRNLIDEKPPEEERIFIDEESNKKELVIKEFKNIVISDVNFGLYKGEYSYYKETLQLVPNGKGQLIFPSKEFLYDGNFNQNGRRNGFGKLWRINKIIKDKNGKIVEILKEKFMSGMWKEDFPYGGNCKVRYGKYLIYKGNVKIMAKNLKNLKITNFVKHGFGHLYNQKAGYFYYGSFSYNKRQGIGICDFYDSGRRFIGHWKDDKETLKGCESFADGSFFTGKFLKGKRVSDGQYHFSNGCVIKGKWDNKKISDVKLRLEDTKGNKGYEIVDGNVLRMLQGNLKGFIESEGKSDYNVSKARSQCLWCALLNDERLYKEIEMLGLNFTPSTIKNLLNRDNGYLHQFVSIFCDYFNSIYKLNANILRRRLVYAKDDIFTFVLFIRNTIINMKNEIMKKKDDDVKEDKVKMKNDMKRMKKVIYNLVLNFIMEKIYERLFMLYEIEYKEEEILFKQKIRSLHIILSSLANDNNHSNSFDYYTAHLFALNPSSEYEKYEILSLINLLESLNLSSLSGIRKNERNFLSNMQKSLRLRLIEFKDLLNDFNDLEILEIVDKMNIYKSLIDNVDATKNVVLMRKLDELAESLKSKRIALISSHEIIQLSKLSKHFKMMEKDLQGRVYKSIHWQIESLILSNKYILAVMDDKVKKANIDISENMCNSMLYGIEAVIKDCETFENYPYEFVSEVNSIWLKMKSLKSSLKDFVKSNHVIFHSNLNITCVDDYDEEKIRDIEKILTIIFEKKKVKKYVIQKWDSIKKVLKKFIEKERFKESDGDEFLTKFKDPITFVFENDTIILKCIMKEIKHLKETLSQTESDLFSSLLKRISSITNDITYYINSIRDKREFLRNILNIKLRLKSIKEIIEMTFVNYNKSEHCNRLIGINKKAYKILLSKCKSIDTKKIVSKKKKVLNEHRKSLLQDLDELSDVVESNSSSVNSLQPSELIKTFIKNIKIGEEVINERPTNFQNSKIISSLKLLSMGIKSIQSSLEVEMIKEHMKKLNKMLVFGDNQSIYKKATEKVVTRCLDMKYDVIKSGLKMYNKKLELKGVSLDAFGVKKEFIPKRINSKRIVPYEKSIRVLMELRNCKEMGKKLEVLQKFESTLIEELLEINKNELFKMNVNIYADADLLPIIFYIFLKSNLNHMGEFNYIKDFSKGLKLHKMLGLYQKFIEYVRNVDPFSSGDGNDFNDYFKLILDNLNEVKERKGVNLDTFIDVLQVVNEVLNLVYCSMDMNKTLCIRSSKLKKRVNGIFELIREVLNLKSVGFNLEVDGNFDDEYVITFVKKLPNLHYRMILEKFAKEYQDYLISIESDD